MKHRLMFMPEYTPLRRLFLVMTAVCLTVITPGCRPRSGEPRVEYTLQKVAFQIGETKIHAHVIDAGSSPLTMVHLHEDERTAAQAGRMIVEKYGGRLIQLVHSGQRRVAFSLDGAKYTFDPNRIFTPGGVTKTLRGDGPIPEKVYAVVNDFAAQFVRYFSLGKQRSLIALHNNGEGLLSITSYAPGAENGVDTEKLFVSPNTDPDNFYYVTDERFFSTLKDLNFNVILQNNHTVVDDGSLSVYAGRHSIPYINVEAQDEQLAENVRMIEAALKLGAVDLTSSGE